MERAEWLRLMNVKCKLLAMGDGFTRAISQALFPEVLFPNFCTSTVYAIPRDMGRSDLSRSLRDVSEARVGKIGTGARWGCALAIHRLEGSRPRLRRTRGYASSIERRVRCGDAPGACGRARHPKEGEKELLGTQKCCERVTSRSWKKRLLDKKAQRDCACRDRQWFRGVGRVLKRRRHPGPVENEVGSQPP
jgi:hypothetical protein